jgi:alginate O-acetyltransferase complex protein AlgI
MRFHSLDFILLFLPLFFIFWNFLKDNHKPYLIAIASIIFYSWGDARYALLFLLTALIDYSLAIKISSEESIRKRKTLLFIAITCNLLLLAYFKYFLTQMKFFLPDAHSPLSDLLPIGMSFYIFQSMSYSIDVYLKRAEVEKNFFYYLAYLSLFPQLIAGPICRFSDVIEQIKHHKKPTEDERFEGCKLIILGYFKKIIIADYLNHYVTSAFAKSSIYENTTYWWLIMLAFTYQIYFDFSAYTDIARGLCQLMGIKLKRNFNFPYRANSFGNFWQRWHISLSSWFRDYVYIPLGGSQKGEVRTVVNIWLTMILSGLWHGLGLTYLFWSMQHAFFLNLEKFYLNTRIKKSLLYSPFIFIMVLLSWVWFRATNFNQAIDIFFVLFRLTKFQLVDLMVHKELAMIISLAIVADQIEYIRSLGRFFFPLRVEITFFLILFLITIFFRSTTQDFIYFKF